MSLGSAFRDASRTYIARPAEFLPLYFLGTAVPAVARTLPFVGLLVGYLLLLQAGRLDELGPVLQELGPIPIDDPEAAVDPDEAAVEQLVEVFAAPEILLPLVVSVVLAVLVVLVLNAAITAGEIHAIFAVLRGERGVRAAIDGAIRHATTFIGLLFAELLTYAFTLGFVAVLVGLLAVVSPALGILVGGIAALAMLAVLPAIRLVFAFAPIATVVDDANLIAAIRGGSRYVIRHPVEAIGYGLVSIVLFVTLATVGGVFAVLGAEAVGTLLAFLIALPLLDLMKTILYGRASPQTRIAIPEVPERSPRVRLQSELVRGWRELVVFTRGHLGLVAVSVAVFAATGYLGWVFSAGLEGTFTASIERRLEGVIAIGSFFEYAAHNWQVAVAQTYSGIGFGIPTLVSLATNGLMLGVIFRLEVAPMLLLYFVIPHGIVEIPALFLSGALGLYLGVVSWRFVRGRVDRDGLAAAIERTYAGLIGLAILFTVAAVIEAFVSPYYWRLLGL